jgi:hypothetical protein
MLQKKFGISRIGAVKIARGVIEMFWLAWALALVTLALVVVTVFFGLSSESFSFEGSSLDAWGEYIGGVLGAFATIILAITVLVQAHSVKTTNNFLRRSFSLSAAPVVHAAFVRTFQAAGKQMAVLDKAETDNIFLDILQLLDDPSKNKRTIKEIKELIPREKLSLMQKERDALARECPDVDFLFSEFDAVMHRLNV